MVSVQNLRQYFSVSHPMMLVDPNSQVNLIFNKRLLKQVESDLV